VREIIYKQIVEIDSKQYTIFACDYSESISELVEQGEIGSDSQSAIDHIFSEIETGLV
jgi:hypothetical protein